MSSVNQYEQDALDIDFRTNRLERTLNEERELVRTYGARMARAIQRRLATIDEARTLSEVPTTPPERRHQLHGERRGQYAVDLIHPYRLIFEPNHDPVPRRPDGAVETDHVTAITIVEVIDYH